MGRTYSCWRLNWWCITWQVGLRRLIRHQVYVNYVGDRQLWRFGWNLHTWRSPTYVWSELVWYRVPFLHTIMHLRCTVKCGDNLLTADQVLVPNAFCNAKYHSWIQLCHLFGVIFCFHLQGLIAFCSFCLVDRGSCFFRNVFRCQENYTALHLRDQWCWYSHTGWHGSTGEVFAVVLGSHFDRDIRDINRGYYYYYYYCYYYYYLLQLSCNSVAVVFTIVQTKQIRVKVRKGNNTKTQ